MNIPMIVSRLQLGTSRLEKLSPPARMAFVDKSWIHLGDQPQPFLRRVGRILLAGDALFTRTMYRNTDFREFFSILVIAFFLRAGASHLYIRNTSLSTFLHALLSIYSENATAY